MLSSRCFTQFSNPYNTIKHLSGFRFHKMYQNVYTDLPIGAKRPKWINMYKVWQLTTIAADDNLRSQSFGL